MNSLCLQRLQEERKKWRKDHPFGFWAKPTKKEDGSMNLQKWEAGIPGREGTIWKDGVYPITIEYPDDYPSKPPRVKFPAGFYHPNIYPSGTVCLSILNEDQDWKPAITMKQILLGVQDLLTSPNPNSPAQEPAWRAYAKNLQEYEKKVLEQARRYAK